MNQLARTLPFLAALLAGALIWAHHEGKTDIDASIVGDANSGHPSFAPFPAQGVQLLGWLTLGALEEDLAGMTITSGSDCWGWVSPAGREYAIIGHSAGTSFVDITDPVAPVIIETISGPTSIWREIKTYGSYAYIVSEGGDGIQVVDLSEIDDGTVSRTTTVTSGGSEATHTIALDETSGYLYRCGGSGNGLRIYDLADPASPDYITAWSDRYVHDALIVTYDDGPYAGKQIAFCCAGLSNGWVDSGLTILDVTDKSDIVELVHLEYDGATYSHQCWLTEDRQYLFLDDELDEIETGIETTTYVIDVADLEAPFLATTFSNGLTSTDHNQFVVGDRLFQANYTSGLRVWDVSDPLLPEEIAWFDTWPEDDDTGYTSLWGTYPFFPSGLVIGSDIEMGLFIWRIGDPPLTFLPTDPLPEFLDPAGHVMTVEIQALAGHVLDAATATLSVEILEEITTYPLEEVRPGVFAAEFPPLECGKLVFYWFSAYTTEGIISVDPLHAPFWHHHALVGLGEEESFFDDMESDLGWQAGAPGDDATTGVWVRDNPIGTDAQPADDHSERGTRCWFTGQGTSGGELGQNDVDGGATTLLTPLFDLTSSIHPVIGYWRWLSNQTAAGPGKDPLVVELSADGGATWVEVETVGPDGPEASGGWYYHELDPLALATPSAEIQLRFVASDTGDGSVVEAAIDDFRVWERLCGDDCDDNAQIDVEEIAVDPSVDCDTSGVLDVCEIADGLLADADGDGIPDSCNCTPFVRGDFDGDTIVTIADVINFLAYSFTGGDAPAVIESADSNGDGATDISDPIYLLGYLFLRGDPPPPPFPDPAC